jgi:ribonuclease Z
VRELAAGAAALIHEATTPEPFRGHSSPRQAGEVAAAAGVGRLVLVHYSPRWTMPEDAALAAVRAGGFDGAAEIGREYQQIELG